MNQPTSGSGFYIPALNRHWLTPFYDVLLAALMREREFKGRLVRQIEARPGERLLDLGCGTGTLTEMLGRSFPGSELSGLDIDPEVLRRAARKTARAGVPVTFDQGSATALPYPADHFDHVVSSLVLHHLKIAQKEAAAREVRRVLRPGGKFHVVDFGPPVRVTERAIVALMNRFEETADNFAGRLPEIFAAAGLAEVREVGRRFSLFGPLVFYRAVKPLPSALSE